MCTYWIDWRWVSFQNKPVARKPLADRLNKLCTIYHCWQYILPHARCFMSCVLSWIRAQILAPYWICSYERCDGERRHMWSLEANSGSVLIDISFQCDNYYTKAFYFSQWYHRYHWSCLLRYCIFLYTIKQLVSKKCIIRRGKKCELYSWHFCVENIYIFLLCKTDLSQRIRRRSELLISNIFL